MDDPIYTQNKIATGVLVGGPMAGGYYVWRTFKALGHEKYAWTAPVAAILLLILAYLSIFVPPFDRIPNFVFWGLQIGLVYGVIRGFLLNDMTAHIAAGKPVFGWGNTLLVAVLSMILTIGPIIGLLFWKPAVFDMSTSRYFGKLQHEIVFDPSNMSELEVGHLASALTDAGFFDEEQQKSIDAWKTGNKIIITIFCTDAARDPEAVEWHRALRKDVQTSFPANPIAIDMVVDTPDHRIGRLE